MIKSKADLVDDPLHLIPLAPQHIEESQANQDAGKMVFIVFHRFLIFILSFPTFPDISPAGPSYLASPVWRIKSIETRQALPTLLLLVSQSYIWEVFLCLHILSKRCHFFLNFGALFETLLN